MNAIFRIIIALVVTLTLAFPAAAQYATAASAQQQDELLIQPSEQFRWTQLIVPGAVLAGGVVGAYSSWYKDHVDIPVRDYATRISGGNRLHFDDYIQYIPIAAFLGLGYGVPTEHGMAERLCITATAYASMSVLVNAAKYTIRVPRPDNATRNSFPSGHTATAFMGAELMRREYGPWWGLGGYAIAATTALMRVYNGRHWTSDLLGGAALGILSVDIAYSLLPLERRILNIQPGQNRVFTVLPTPYGISVACVF